MFKTYNPIDHIIPPGLAQRIAGAKKSGLTFAPEAGTQRLLDVINKGLAEEEVLQKALEAGKTAELGEIMHEHWLHKKQRFRGMSNPQIAEALVISRKTVEHHIEHIFNKLGVSSRTAAVAFAVQEGLT